MGLIALGFGAALALGFGDGTVPPGTAITSRQQTTLQLRLDVELPTGLLVRSIYRHHTQHSEVQVDEAGFTVRWTENHHRAREPGYRHDRDLEVLGPTYRVDDAIRREDGRALSEAERDIVGQVDVLSLLPTLRQMLGAEPQVGVSMPAGPMFAGMMSDAPGQGSVVSGIVTLVEVVDREGRDCGRVALDLVLRAEGEDTRGAHVITDFVATGEAWIEVETGWTRHFEVSGDVAVTATRSDLSTTGVGRFHTSTVLDFSRVSP
ncbi:MAG: hypothetical protein KC912_22480 [Proteobacteria bacterium]|nr:hypothetical protein [Pseudomonadota bacterium]